MGGPNGTPVGIEVLPVEHEREVVVVGGPGHPLHETQVDQLMSRSDV